jgi:thiamine pyrophosphate-dependent acetolactate synthase large subunit-like protein
LSRPARSSLAAALLAALRDHGAREIFGIPGDFALGLFDAIEREGTLPLYTPMRRRASTARRASPRSPTAPGR